MSKNQDAAVAAPVKKFNIKTLTGIGLLTAIVIVLQFVCLALRPTGFFNITLCLVPIVVGAALYGVKAGAWLGFVFGVIVTITDSAAFMVINAPATIGVCILKGTLAGLAAGAVFKLLEKKNLFAAVITAGIVCPVVNTGTFALGCLAFFMPTIAEWGLLAGVENATYYLFAGVISVNFFIELAVNLLLSSVIVTIIKLGIKSR
ncbi:MAG: ECF transporter S component [Firmicutes bacterium]|nr:ECF transporter S component [[Eubacterium] siraeum]MCM1487609.1 ECF transporter S component [Bacillota bacterium]